MILKILGGLTVLIIASVLLVGGYLGFIPGMATLFGSDRPRDLGITFTQKDFQEIDNKDGVEGLSLPNGETKARFEGSHEFKAQITSVEATAIAHNSVFGLFPLRQVQIRFNGDGTAELSGLLSIGKILPYVQATGGSKYDLSKIIEYFKLPDLALPVYVKAGGSVSNNTVNANWQSVQVGKLTVPTDLVSKYTPQANDFLDERLNKVTGLNLKSMSVKGGKLDFDATLPDKVYTSR